MKKQTRLIWIILALTANLLVATGSAAANDTRREFVGEHYLCSVGAPEGVKYTGSPPVEHMRGFPWTGRALSKLEELYRADSEGIQNWNFNPATDSGGTWGTFVKYVDDKDGRWEGTFSGQYIGHFPDGAWHIKVRGHGKDALAGMKYFATFVPKDVDEDDTSCPGGAKALLASDVYGVIVDTRRK